jgi:asparagine synthase (glutamine-hydrolysing)
VRSAPYTIVFNGEIYNYLEIRDSLRREGCVFSTESDTEVILAAYAVWGECCVERFDGMWAFVIHDQKRGVLFCSRDRLGVKPFHYTIHDGIFLFASEIKGLLPVFGSEKPRLDSYAIELYFGLGFIPSPWTAFESIRKLAPAHNLIYTLRDASIHIKRYWQPGRYRPSRNRAALACQTLALIDDATAIRMRADVPVGAFLSGGIDSTLVVSSMVRSSPSTIRTFSVGFEGAYDETPAVNVARKAFRTRHTRVPFTSTSIPSLVVEYAGTFDEPYADFGFLPMFAVSKKAAGSVKVVLTGDGGDEVFGGYTSYANLAAYEQMRSVPTPLRWAAKVFFDRLEIEPLSPLGKLKELVRWSLTTDATGTLLNLYPGTRF